MRGRADDSGGTSRVVPPAAARICGRSLTMLHELTSGDCLAAARCRKGDSYRSGASVGAAWPACRQQEHALPVGISWNRERSAAASAAGEGSDEIGAWRGPRVVGMESKASVSGSRCTLDSSDSCERRAACAARSVASSCVAARSSLPARSMLPARSVGGSSAMAIYPPSSKRLRRRRGWGGVRNGPARAGYQL